MEKGIEHLIKTFEAVAGKKATTSDASLKTNLKNKSSLSDKIVRQKLDENGQIISSSKSSKGKPAEDVNPYKVAAINIRYKAHYLAKQGQYYGAVLLMDWAEIMSNCSADELPDFPKELQYSTLKEASRILKGFDMIAEHLYMMSPTIGPYMEFYDFKRKIQSEVRQKLGLKDYRTFYCCDDQVRNVGHIAQLEYMVKMVKLGWSDYDNLAIMAPPERVANQALLDVWGKHINIISSPQGIAEVSDLAGVVSHHTGFVPVRLQGKSYFYTEGYAMIQQEWERRGLGPLLTAADLPPEIEEFGKASLRALGVPEGAWFACLHNREGGFHQDTKSGHSIQRNGNILNYIPAIEEITSRGGWVIRLGNPTMKRLPKMKNVVDYCHTFLRGPEMDTYLSAHCKFILGGCSGMSQVPHNFGKPTLFINWIGSYMPMFASNCLFIPRLVRLPDEDRVLTLEEMCSLEWLRQMDNSLHLQAVGGEIMSNSPHEIRDATIELMDRIDGKIQYSEAEEKAQARFIEIKKQAGIVSNVRMASKFLMNNSFLLEHWPYPAKPVTKQKPSQIEDNEVEDQDLDDEMTQDNQADNEGQSAS